MDLPCEPIFSAEIQHAGFSLCAVQRISIGPLSEYPVRLMLRIFKSKGEKPKSEPYFPVNRVNGHTVFRLGRNQDGSDEWSLRYGRLFIAFL